MDQSKQNAKRERKAELVAKKERHGKHVKVKKYITKKIGKLFIMPQNLYVYYKIIKQKFVLLKREEVISIHM